MDTPQGATPVDILQHIRYAGTKLDFVRFQARHAIPVHLSEGEITLVAYLFLFKDLAVGKLLSDGHSKSEKSVLNYMSSLRKKGIVVGKALTEGLYLSENPDKHYFTFELTDGIN